ncbi:MAG: hypothetical protein J5884_03355 [Paludibacteraceae bacterium]|nr:hypothetical protein [Paludibacteraceae bacterium]
MHIYVASSWRNTYYPEVVSALRDAGHSVYDFRNPPSGDPGFHWTDVDEHCADWTPKQYQDNLSHELQTMSKQFNQYNAPVYNNSTVYNAPVTINNYDSRPSSGQTEDRPASPDRTQAEDVEEQHFALLTAQCIQEGKAQVVEAELRSAASGSAQKLMQCIRTNEALGYIDTKNLSSQALYDELNACFGLKYKYQNFAKYRRD